MQDHQERWRIAVHEAGHVIAAVLSGVPVNSATVIPYDDALGSVYLDEAAPLMVNLAGAAAELAVLGRVSAAGLNSDRVKAALQGDGSLRAAWRSTCQEMRKHRQALHDIATSLVKKDYLGVVQLYESVLPLHFPGVRHPRFYAFEETSSEWAARVGANENERIRSGPPYTRRATPLSSGVVTAK